MGSEKAKRQPRNQLADKLLPQNVLTAKRKAITVCGMADWMTE